MKVCKNPKCSNVNPQPLNQFRKSSQGYYSSNCNTCHRIYMITWHNGKKLDWKRNKPKSTIKTTREQKLLEKKSWKVTHREQETTNKKLWREANKGKCNADAMKHYAIKLQRTPPWLTKEQLAEIEEFYITVKELQWLSDPSDPLQVDHIVPLQGKNVSGLHVPWNLQIIPRSLNLSKNNKFTQPIRNLNSITVSNQFTGG